MFKCCFQARCISPFSYRKSIDHRLCWQTPPFTGINCEGRTCPLVFRKQTNLSCCHTFLSLEFLQVVTLDPISPVSFPAYIQPLLNPSSFDAIPPKSLGDAQLLQKHIGYIPTFILLNIVKCLASPQLDLYWNLKYCCVQLWTHYED